MPRETLPINPGDWESLTEYLIGHGTLAMSTVGSAPAGNGPYWLCAAGNVLYSTVSNDSVIKAYDITRPDGVPVLLGTVTVGTSTAWIEKAGKYLYATDGGNCSLRAIDVSNPAAMTVAATVQYDASGGTGGGRFGLQVRGNLLLVGGAENGANANKSYLFDISVPSAPVIVGTLPATGTTLRGVCSFGASYFALCSRDDKTVRIIDASVPTAPVAISTITTTVTNTTAAVQNQGRYLYVGNYGNGGTAGGLEVWDVSTPGNPVQAGTLAITGGAEQMVIRGGYLYIAHRAAVSGNIFSLVEIRNPALPRLLTTFAVGVGASRETPGIAVSNGYIYRTSNEQPGPTSGGVVYAVRMVDDILRRISAIEDFMQLRPSNVV